LNLSQKHIVLLIVLLLFFSGSEAQCAMCRAVLESEESQSTAKGINNGIVYLMVIPYVLIGGLAYYIYRKLSTK
jgi:Na+/H+ antiporter NhaC